MDYKFGLNQQTIQKITDVFLQYKSIKKVIIYGSRAKGTHKIGSDIDLTLKGDISLSLLLKIENDIDDLLLPYKVDLSIYDQIDNSSVREHIDRIGEVFFERCNLF